MELGSDLKDPVSRLTGFSCLGQVVKLSFAIFPKYEMLYIEVRDDKSWSKLKFISAFSWESLQQVTMLWQSCNAGLVTTWEIIRGSELESQKICLTNSSMSFIQLEVTSKNTSFVKLKLDSRFIFVCVPSPPEPLKSFIVCFVYSWRQERNQWIVMKGVWRQMVENFCVVHSEMGLSSLRFCH